MDRRTFARYLPLAIGITLLVLLAVLATFQYRWIGQVSEFESHRMRASLRVAGSHFADDFDREVTRAFFYFHPPSSDEAGDLAARLARQYGRWLAEAPYPRLVRDLFYIHRDAAGALQLEALRPAAGRFETVPWPPDLQELRRHLAGEAPAFGPGPPLLSDLPAILIPNSRRTARRDDGRESDSRGGPPAGDHLLVRLDRDAIAREILPALTRRHFGTAQGDREALAVVEAENPGRIVFLSDPKLPAASFRSGDVVVPMFGLGRFEELRSLSPRRRLAAVGPEPGPPARDERRGGVWKLIIKRRNGSLEEVVARIRLHNLAIGASILALVAVTTGLMMVTTQRAQRLAAQQIEFVAAVSHELHTPLTAIRSAGQNLADGVVADPRQVKRYGALIESEGRRLSEMVGQVLDFAGIQSGRQAYTLQPTEVAPVVEGALAECRWFLQERRARVERDVPPGLPPVKGDPAALQRALRNLIENAAKYGGSDPWIGVRARAAAGEVEITVEDRGTGIRREDLAHLFKPFYRGREAIGRSIAGSGLGLSVVRHIAAAHHGRVSVETGGPGEGSAFTLHLPAGEAAA